MQIVQQLRRNCSAVAIAVLGMTATAFPVSAATVTEVADTYANIALAAYEDSTSRAKELRSAIERLIATPTDATLGAARAAWIAARVPYMQTEAYRFGNKIVDDWEGRVNAWPLDEGLIDYVDASYGTASDSNPLYAANIIANKSLTVGGRKVDAGTITKELLRSLQEAERIEANVATGYHAIEFLLWGQDLNGTGPGAGARPATDYDLKRCTGGNCDRRIAYLRVATDLLIEDLEEMVGNWKPDGAARKALAEPGADPLVAIFKGLGSLTYGELAGERMKLGLLLNDPEEEHDCFSDNTHNSHYYNVIGIENVYFGRYKRIDGTTVAGPSVSDLVKAKSADIDVRVREALAVTNARMTTLKARAETVEAYDQMIGEGNKDGNALVESVIAALIAQAKEFERAVAVLELKVIEFEGSDSLDNPVKALSGKK
jgi:putative iron-regulated protein